MGTENTLELSEAEALQEERNEKLMSQIALYVAHCGGDVARATDAQTERMADALAAWILTSEAG
jgi:hypothetical protein